MSGIDKDKVRQAFDRAADQYDNTAKFQHQVCQHLLEFLPPYLSPARILDGGCGTGFGAEMLHQRWPSAHITGCDLSPEMVRKTQARGIDAICADLEALPFAEQKFDLIWSNLALQWCQPERSYPELFRLLKTSGKLFFTTLLPGTLHELETAFSGIDEHRHVLSFPTQEEIQAKLRGAGFDHIQTTHETWITYHDDFRSLLTTIRGIGASHSGSERRRSLMGKNAWQTALSRYDAMKSKDGKLPTTYEVMFVQAQKVA